MTSAGIEGLTEDDISFSVELCDQLTLSLNYLAQDDAEGAKRIADFLNTSKDGDLWWHFFAHFKVVVEDEFIDEEPPEVLADC